MNYKINNTSVCLDKFTSLVVSFFWKTTQILCIRAEVFSVLLNFSSGYAGCNQPAIGKRFEWFEWNLNR